LACRRLNAYYSNVLVILSRFARAVSRAASFTTQAASLIGRPASDRLVEIVRHESWRGGARQRLDG
jgi:hypothetical protein